MSEKPIYYQLNANELKGKPCTLDVSHPNFEQPTPSEIKALRAHLGMSQTDLAKFVGVNHNYKGSSAVRKWETSTDHKEHRKIPKSAWKLMLIKAGWLELQPYIER